VRVVFLGNHTVGVTALESLLDVAEVTGVVAHAPDPEDGVRYASVYDSAVSHGVPVIRASGRDARLATFVIAAKPDLLWITDYRYLLPGAILALAPLGAINLHPSLLPAYRGRAPLNWAILHGERELGLSAHVVDEGMDTGDLLAQRRITLDTTEDVGDALARLMPAYAELPRTIVQALEAGTLQRTPQDHTTASAFPARRPADGIIDWARPARAVHNLVRAVAAPYPGAFTHAGPHRVTVWRARPVTAGSHHAPGTVLDMYDSVPVVQCADGALALEAIESDFTAWQPGVTLA
jgi:methionyl-tRNA formyltransferase